MYLQIYSNDYPKKRKSVTGFYIIYMTIKHKNIKNKHISSSILYHQIH